jgi:hypothetical protein
MVTTLNPSTAYVQAYAIASGEARTGALSQRDSRNRPLALGFSLRVGLTSQGR